MYKITINIMDDYNNEPVANGCSGCLGTMIVICICIIAALKYLFF